MKAKSTLNLILSTLLLLLLPILISKEYRAFKPKKQTYQLPEESQQPRLTFSNKEEKAFVVVVFSRADEIFSSRALQSVFDQNYPHYRIIYLNIGDENGLDEAKDYVQKLASNIPVTFVQCDDDESFQDEFSNVVKHCRNDEIIVHLEGRDWLANEESLTKLNEAYHDPDVWLVYGQYLEYPTYRVGKHKKFPLGRSQKPWMGARFKSYYAGLVKQVKFSDLQSSDFLASIVEMAKWHIRYVPEVLSVQSTRKKKGVGKIEESAKSTLKKWRLHLGQALGEHT